MPEMTRKIPKPVWHESPDQEAMVSALTERLYCEITEAVLERESAYLALAGGSTPVPAYQRLGETKLDMSRVTLVPTDERWVTSDSDLSNERMLREAFGSDARILSLRNVAKIHSPPNDQSLQEPRAILRGNDRIFDVVLLGMGADGHTASLFPDDPGLGEALASDQDLMPAFPASQPTPRVTLTPKRLKRTRAILLAIRGADKRAVLEQALSGEDFPIATLLRALNNPVEVYYSP